MPLLHEPHFRAVENLVFEWARAIDENRVEDICTLLHPEGRYRVQSRFNADRGLPHALMDAHSAAQLRDRIKSMRLFSPFNPRFREALCWRTKLVWGKRSRQDW